MLDNFAAGNILSGEDPLDGIVREAYEETGIPADFTRADIQSCGTVTYWIAALNDGRPGCQHRYQFVFDIQLPADLVPRPNDGVVEAFTLMSLYEVQEALMQGESTPNRTLTYLGHLYSSRLLNSNNENG